MPIFFIHSFIGRMSELNNRYCLETQHFLKTNNCNIPSETPHQDYKFQTGLSRFEIFPGNKKFCNKPTPL